MQESVWLGTGFYMATFSSYQYKRLGEFYVNRWEFLFFLCVLNTSNTTIFRTYTSMHSRTIWICAIHNIEIHTKHFCYGFASFLCVMRWLSSCAPHRSACKRFQRVNLELANVRAHDAQLSLFWSYAYELRNLLIHSRVRLSGQWNGAFRRRRKKLVPSIFGSLTIHYAVKNSSSKNCFGFWEMSSRRIEQFDHVLFFDFSLHRTRRCSWVPPLVRFIDDASSPDSIREWWSRAWPSWDES